MASTSSSKRHDLDLRQSSWPDEGGSGERLEEAMETKCGERRDIQSLERREMENEEHLSILHHHFAREVKFIQQICTESQLCTGDAQRG